MSTAQASTAILPHARIRDEIRIALAMTGGVALTVYEAGVAHEWWRAAVAGPASNVYGQVLHHAGASLIVDIVTGASAGGINAIMLGSALATGGDFGRLHDLWLKAADLKALRHKGPAVDSLLDSTILQTAMRESLTENVDAANRGRRRMRGRDLDVIITRTNLTGRHRILTDALGHRAAVLTKEDPIHFTADDFCSLHKIETLTKAAAATSAVPVVFPTVEMDGAFYADGGILDNQPLGHAIKAVRDKRVTARAHRFVAFVEPNPEGLKPPVPRRPSVGEVAVQLPLMGIKGNIWNAVVDLEDFNRRWDHYQRIGPLISFAPAAEVPASVRFDELLLAHDATRYARWRSVAGLAFRDDAAAQQAWLRAVIDKAGDADLYLRWLRALITEIDSQIEDPGRSGTVKTLVATSVQPADQSAKAALYDRLGRLIRALYPRDVDDEDDSPFNFGRAIDRWQPLLVRDLHTTAEADAWALDIGIRGFPDRVGRWMTDRTLTRTGEVPVDVIEDSMQEIGRRYKADPDFREICERVSAAAAHAAAVDPTASDRDLGSILFRRFAQADRKSYTLEALTDLRLKPDIKFVRISPNDARNLDLIGQSDPGEDVAIGPRKLSGELFGHMGGFLDEAWRRNDYVWGRLDAAQIIVDMIGRVCGERAFALNAGADRTTALRQLQDEILTDEYERQLHADGAPLPRPGVGRVEENQTWIGLGGQRLWALPPERISDTLRYLLDTALVLARGDPRRETGLLHWTGRLLRAVSVLARPARWLIPTGSAVAGRGARAWVAVVVAAALVAAGFVIGRFTLDGVVAGLTAAAVTAAVALVVFLLGAVAGWRWWFALPATAIAAFILGARWGPAWLRLMDR